ncbi:MAG: cation:proton antiporter [Burkholderiaceae bacterium]|nr:cation:proton antiporter [Burkholderiaceae bacterium]
MTFAIWALIAGAIFTVMALSGTLLKRLPLSTSMLYLIAGFALGPAGLALLDPSPSADHAILEIVVEAAVLISLFAVGLKLTLPLSHGRWRAPLRLATLSMLITIALLSAIGIVLFDLAPGAAILLAAILAPTDPVLASDVQLADPNDRDAVRFSLTGEGGLNDGAAFPFVMLGLGLIGLRDPGAGLWRWLTFDLIWATAGGLAIGAICGYAIGKLVLYLRTEHKEAVGLDEFLMLGLVGVAYGAAQLASTYGFLAVFAAGLALQRSQRQATGASSQRAAAKVADQPLEVGSTERKEELATDPKLAGAYMTQAVRGFNEQLERIVEVAIVVIVGAMLTLIDLPGNGVVFLLLLFFVVRPVAVGIGLIGLQMPRDQRLLIGWFGIRGIGSIYYLLFAIGQGLPAADTQLMLSIVLTAVAASIVVHGISVTPLMKLYSARRPPRRSR